MVLFNLVAAGSNMPEMGGSITPEGDSGAHRRLACSALADVAFRFA
jgi:hypothetical protein